jgi:hypothetical protein
MQRRVSELLINRKQEEIRIERLLGRMLLIITYVIYVLSSSSVLREVIPVEAKHLFFLIVAALSALIKSKQSLISVGVAFPIALVYLFGGLWLYAAMVLVFAMSVPLIWEGISSLISCTNKWYLIILLFISLIPAVLSLPVLIDEGLFDAGTYGRPRMLLGYFHPKEAATAFAIPMLIMMISRKSLSIFYALSLCTFLWIVGSRNIALLLILAWLLYWHTRFVLSFVLAITPLLMLWLFLIEDWFYALDNLLSLRLSVWQDLFLLGQDLRGLDIESGDRFGADNFFVEAFVISGPIAFLGAILWVLFVGLILKIKNAPKWSIVALVLLVFNATFDSGIASTGNILHVFLWSIMLSPLFIKSQPNIK